VELTQSVCQTELKDRRGGAGEEVVALGEGGARGKLGGECVSGAEAIAGEDLSKEYSFTHLSEWRLRNLFK
jgi:hypothetical protein